MVNDLRRFTCTGKHLHYRAQLLQIIMRPVEEWKRPIVSSFVVKNQARKSYTLSKNKKSMIDSSEKNFTQKYLF